MTREEAAGVLKRLWDRFSEYDKYMWPEEKVEALTAIATLREPAHEWVRTTDRLPTEEDAIEVHDEWGCTHKEVACLATGWPFEALVKDRPAMVPAMQDIETIKQMAKQYPYWMPLPKLPEVEG